MNMEYCLETSTSDQTRPFFFFFLGRSLPHFLDPGDDSRFQENVKPLSQNKVKRKCTARTPTKQKVSVKRTKKSKDNYQVGEKLACLARIINFTVKKDSIR